MKVSRSFLLKTLLFGILLSVFLQPAAAWATDTPIEKNNGWSYTYVNKVEVKNPSSQSINNIRIEVPLPSRNQGSWQEFMGEEFNPRPQDIVTNTDGSRTAVYVLSSLPANSTKVLEHRYSFTNYAITYNGDFMQATLDTNADGIDEKYLKPEQYIESDNPAIMKYMEGLKLDDQNPYVIAKRMFADINTFMTYENKADSPHSAMQALQTGRGNCLDYTYLYIACLRAAGIPARMYNGFLYSPDENNQAPYLGANGMIQTDLLKHSWVEFYVDGVGWVVADPTYTYTVTIDNKAQKMVDWSRFAGITKSHRLLTWNDGKERDIVFTYNGTKPEIKYSSQLALYAMILPYKDIAGHWAADSIMNLRYWSTPIVAGISDNEFGVSQEITRAELVAMINRVLDYTNPMADEALKEINFSDVPADYWARTDIKKAVNRGFVSGFPDGTFQPGKEVTRAELAAILCAAGNIQGDGKSPFTDLTQSGYQWAKQSIDRLYQAGLATGVTSTTFMPQKTLTRGEAAVFIDRWINSDFFNLY